LDDDLNTPEAIAAVFDAVTEFNRSGDDTLAASARQAMEVLGFSFEEESVGDALTPQLLDLLIRSPKRENAEISVKRRDPGQISGYGIALEDGVESTTWKRV
jgi:cysteinyl-tRNA synthetase